MNKTKFLIGLIIVLVFLVGIFAGYMIFRSGGAEPVDPTATKATALVQDLQTLLQFDPEDLAAISLQNEQNTLLFRAVSGGSSNQDIRFTLQEPAWPVFDASAVKQAALRFLQIKYSKHMSEDKEELSAYGLEKPWARIRYQLKDGREVTLCFGKLLPDGRQYYVSSTDAKGVYIVDQMRDLIKLSALELIPRQLVNIPNELITAFTLTRKSDALFLALALDQERQEQTHAAGKSTDAGEELAGSATYKRIWKLTQPVEWQANNSEINSMVSEFSSIIPDEYIAYAPPDLAEYGLLSPAYHIEIHLKESPLELEKESLTEKEAGLPEDKRPHKSNTLQLDIGNVSGEGKRFAKFSHYPLVFTVNMISLSMIDRPLLNLCSPFLRTVNISELAQLQLSWPAENLLCEVFSPNLAERAEGKTQKFLVNGENADIMSSTQDNYFKVFYQSLIGLRIDGLAATESPLYAAEIKIVYTLRQEGSVPIEVALVPRDAESYYAFIDGQYTKFYVSANQLRGDGKAASGVYTAWARLKEAMAHAHGGVYDIPLP